MPCLSPSFINPHSYSIPSRSYCYLPAGIGETVNVRLDSHPQDDGESNEGNVVSRIDTNTREMTRANAKRQRTRDVHTVIFFLVRKIPRATQCHGCVDETFKSLSFIFESLITPTPIPWHMYSLYLSLHTKNSEGSSTSNYT